MYIFIVCIYLYYIFSVVKLVLLCKHYSNYCIFMHTTCSQT